MLTRFTGVSFPVLLTAKKKVLVIKLKKKNYTPYSQAACNRQINNSLAHFYFFIYFIFFLSAYSSTFDTTVEWKREEKIV